MTDVIIHAPVASASAVGPDEDYFSVDEFRATTGDRSVPFVFDDEDILLNQQEVVERLERWAKTSWRIRDGSWTTVNRYPDILLPHVPIIPGSVSVTLDGTALTDIAVDLLGGRVTWGIWDVPPLLDNIVGLWAVTYQYGFDDVPRSVSRPCMQATESLMRLQEDRSKIPRNATKYSSERTDITTGRRGAIQPWPWDARASDDLRAWWQSFRPVGLMVSS